MSFPPLSCIPLTSPPCGHTVPWLSLPAFSFVTSVSLQSGANSARRNSPTDRTLLFWTRAFSNAPRRQYSPGYVFCNDNAVLAWLAFPNVRSWVWGRRHGQVASCQSVRFRFQRLTEAENRSHLTLPGSCTVYKLTQQMKAIFIEGKWVNWLSSFHGNLLQINFNWILIVFSQLYLKYLWHEEGRWLTFLEEMIEE